MKSYEVRVVPNTDCDGKRYWSAFFPAVESCVGGGATVEEAIAEARENLDFYLDYLKTEKRMLPKEYEEPEYNGKIALRVPKRAHRQLIMLAEQEGVSLNLIINNAIENYLGEKSIKNELRKMLEEFNGSAQNLSVQISLATYSQVKEKWGGDDRRFSEIPYKEYEHPLIVNGENGYGKI